MTLNAGIHVLKAVVDSGDALFNFNDMTFTLGAAPTPSASASSTISSSPSSPPAPPATKALVTYFGWGDNTPPNSTQITYPNPTYPAALHAQAGGTGTWQDPITFGSDTSAYPVGTVIWVPFLQKYFVMEDDCAACDAAWQNGQQPQVALWLGTANASNEYSEENCGTALAAEMSVSPMPVVVSPPNNEPVSTQPLFDASTSTCFNHLVYVNVPNSSAVVGVGGTPSPSPTPTTVPTLAPNPNGGHPSWLDGAVIYDVYTEIFSPGGNLAGVTAQLPRLHNLGVNVVWLMPICPIGQAVNGHPTFDSPYDISDHTAINPNYGSSTDLSTLVQTAHGLGMKVILDMPLNHTSWDNPLITQHPEYYVHRDGNPYNVNSITEAFTFSDVAQLNYKWTVNGVLQTGLQEYMITMLTNWIKNYDIDGFRFDMVDNPPNDGRMVPASFWQELRPRLEAIKPDILMLGEEEDQALTTQPFELDYGWQSQSALAQAAASGNPSGLQNTWQGQINGWPAGTMHMSILQDWDLGADLSSYGGPAGTMDAAVFNFTINGVPLLWNGEEVANDNSADNTHNKIDWNAPNAASFTTFYTSLIGLRDANTALQQGTMTWLGTSNGGQTIAYDRADASGEFVIEINFSGSSASGTLSGIPSGAASWSEVTPTGAPGGRNHALPPSYQLAPHDFAIFRR